MTAAETHRTAEIIKGLGGSHAIIVVEHDMAFVREIAQKITVLHLGQVLAEGDLATIERDPRVRAAYLVSQALA
jgi:urea transport system ATP-binding protein